MPKELVSGSAIPAIGGAPYGDFAEVSGAPSVEVVYDIYREFLATDARSILVVMHPHHWNFILNPAMRVDTWGWSVTGTLSNPVAPAYRVAATTDAVANQAAMVSVRTGGTDGQQVEVTEVVDKPILRQAFSRWDAVSTSPITSTNLLTANQASIETDVSGWAAHSNATVSRDAAQASHGTASLVATATGTPNLVRVQLNPTTTRIPVTPGVPYTASLMARSPVVGRYINFLFNWYKADGSGSSVTAYSEGNTETIKVANAWERKTFTAVPPSDAATCAFIIGTRQNAGPAITTGEECRFDQIGFWQGAGGQWALPGTPVEGINPVRIYDLTGNGRDLVLGTGTAMPTYLPYTGKAYLWFPLRTDAVSDAITCAVGSGPFTDAVVTINGDISQARPALTSSIFQVGDGTTGFAAYRNSTGSQPVYVRRGNSTIDTGKVPTKLWNRFTSIAATGVSTWDHSDDGDEWTQVWTANHGSARPNSDWSSCYLGKSTSYEAGPGSRYYVSAVLDGVKRYEFQASAAIAPLYDFVTNTGTAGGTWNITRAGTGAKSAYVTEPMLSFGGAQNAQTASMTAIPKGTFLMSLREHSDSAINSLMKMEAAGTTGLQMQITANSTNMTAKVGTGTATASLSRHGEHVVGATYDGTTIRTYVDGAFKSSVTGSGNFLPTYVFLGSTATSSMAFREAALWDRVLTDAEIATATDEMNAKISAHPEVNKYTYVLQTGSTLPKATIPFPLTGDLVGYKNWDGVDSLDSTESWVGNSFYLSGTGKIEFRDPAHKDAGGTAYGIYVGVAKDILTDDWYEPGRNSGQWTFSAYVRGSCRVRLRMKAWAPVDPLVAYSPPKYWGIPSVANPASAPYDAAKPAIVDPATGNVWLLKDPPFYRSIGRPPSIASPSTYVPLAVPDEYIMEGTTANVWKIILPTPAVAPYYAKVGTYVDKDNTWDPYTAPPTSDYIRYVDAADPSSNGIIWESMTTGTQGGAGSMAYYEDSGQQQTIAETWSEWDEVVPDEWERQILQTNVLMGDEGTSFLGVAWIQAWLEFEDAEATRFSAFMLDPTEYPVAQYFDGSMTEDAVVDDFLWATSKPEDVNRSVSEYYYDRMARVRFLQAHLEDYVPAGRPYQIFMGSYDDPYIPPDDSVTRALNLRKRL